MSNDYLVRRAGTADATAIRELTRAAYAKWLPEIGREPKPMGADYEAAVRDHLIDLLIRNGELVGLVEMIPHADHLLVENVAVAPTLHGQGLGHFLMQHAEQVAEQGGHTEIRLYTHNRFEENIKFYLKLGYRVDSKDEIADGFRVNMSKHLHRAE
jgi:GNAT superfamily N-acetyltransferase